MSGKQVLMLMGLLLPITKANAEVLWGEFGAAFNLGASINTSDEDNGPFLSADGLTVVFGSDRPGGSGNSDIWMATRTSSHEDFDQPVNMGGVINSDALEDRPCLSADGLTLLFTSSRPGGHGGLDIWISTKPDLDSPFGAPVNVGENVNSVNADSRPCLSSDGLSLYFTSYERPGGYGSRDLWVSTRLSVDDPFGVPSNLGASVNTSGTEGGACVTPDGLGLIFNSDRPGGQGGNDLWYASRTSIQDEFGSECV